MLVLSTCHIHFCTNVERCSGGNVYSRTSRIKDRSNKVRCFISSACTESTRNLVLVFISAILPSKSISSPREPEQGRDQDDRPCPQDCHFDDGEQDFRPRRTTKSGAIQGSSSPYMLRLCFIYIQSYRRSPFSWRVTSENPRDRSA